MNNSNEIKEAVRVILEECPEKLLFIEECLKAIVHKKSISISKTLNEDNPVVTVRIGEYMHKEIFDTCENANAFIDSIRGLRCKVA